MIENNNNKKNTRAARPPLFFKQYFSKDLLFFFLSFVIVSIFSVTARWSGDEFSFDQVLPTLTARSITCYFCFHYYLPVKEDRPTGEGQPSSRYDDQ